MHSLVAAIVLGVAAQAAAAQCVVAAATPTPARGGELIAMAAAGTRDTPSIHKVSVAASGAHARPADADHPRPTGPAMVLTAVAIMSAIALRRAGTSI